MEKMRLYAEAGVKEYWLVDPAAHPIDFLSNRHGKFEVELATDDVYRSASVPSVQMDLAAFWNEVAASCR